MSSETDVSELENGMVMAVLQKSVMVNTFKSQIEG